MQKYELPYASKWYENTPETVMENDKIKILSEFLIHTDLEIKARRPDSLAVDKTPMDGLIIGIAIPGDKRKIERGEREHSESSGFEARTPELVVAGAFVVVTSNSETWTERTDVKIRAGLMQKAALPETARILRKVLEA